MSDEREPYRWPDERPTDRPVPEPRHAPAGSADRSFPEPRHEPVEPSDRSLPEPRREPGEPPDPWQAPTAPHAPAPPREPSIRFQYGPPPPPPPAPEVYKPRIGGNVLLFVLTLCSSIYWGFLQYQSFYADDLRGIYTANPLRAPEAFLGGLPFGIAVIAVLLAHEMGHYLACRHYGIAATLPYFIPFPPLIPIAGMMVQTITPGTMGAVIRIKGAITSRRALFDIAVAGPIAGWITAMPILAYGLSQSRVVEVMQIETSGGYSTLGEPLIWPLLSGWFAPATGPTQDVVVHPLALVGWFALLITSMNLLPVGQLDGGHIMFTLLPTWHRALSYGCLVFMLYAGFVYFPGWIFFAVVVSLLFFLTGGMRHPKPVISDQPLGSARVVLALLALAIFITSFMLVPVTLPHIVGRM